MKQPKMKQAATASIIANVLLLAALLVSVLKWSINYRPALNCADENQDNVKEKGAVGTYCFNFKEAEPAKCREHGGMAKQKGNETLCCVVLSSHLSALIAETLSNRLRSDSARESSLQRVRDMMSASLQNDTASVTIRPAAHLGVLEDGSKAGTDSEVPRVHWEPQGKKSFITGDLQHGGDRVIIKRAGYYFIYAGLQYVVHPPTVPQQWAVVSYVFRDSENSESNRRKLLTARESNCGSRDSVDVVPVSIYMAGIFLLREGDEISVRTDSHSLLHRSPASTYMGVHLI